MSRKGKILADSVKCFLQSDFFISGILIERDNRLKTTDESGELVIHNSKVFSALKILFLLNTKTIMYGKENDNRQR